MKVQADGGDAVLMEQVSVPLRGSGDESGLHDNKQGLQLLFQSPCGEVVMKAEAILRQLKVNTGFSPLAGKW